MNKEQFLKNRQESMNLVNQLIEEGKVEEANAKMAEVEAMDKAFELQAEAAANAKALENKAPKSNFIDANNEGGEEGMKGPLSATAKEEAYVNIWAKDMMNQSLTADEQRIFDEVNDAYRNDPQNAYTHTTDNTGIVIPTTVSKQIWTEVSDMFPLYDDITKLYVNGNITILKEDSSSDAKWYDEDTTTEDGKEEFAELNLTGCELSRSINVSWKLRRMAIDQFIAYIQTKLAEKMGAALGYGVANGKGKPGQSESFKPEPKGILTHLKAETGTPQVVTYSDSDALDYTKFATAMAKIKSGYLKGACVYASNVTIWNNIATVMDSNGKPYFVPDVSTGGVGKMFGLTVKEDTSIPEGEILIGNAKRGYTANINQAITLDSEDHKKERKTDYIGYAIVDGDVVTSKAFALIKK